MGTEHNAGKRSEHEGPLAEFTALRAEILQLNQQQNQVLTLQLTISGAVLSLAITRGSLRAVALIIPLVSYLLYFRFLAASVAIYAIAEYVRKYLGQRVPGGLHWETWVRRHGWQPPIFSIVPRFLTFPGASLLALVWTFGTVFLPSSAAAGPRAGLILLWLLGLAGAAHHTYVVFYGYYRRIQPIARNRILRPRHPKPTTHMSGGENPPPVPQPDGQAGRASGG